MIYLTDTGKDRLPPGQRFRRLLSQPGIIQMPGAYNGLAARQAARAGFEALYLSGAAMSASMGLADLGIITIDEVCFFIRQVARASGLPVLVVSSHDESVYAEIAFRAAAQIATRDLLATHAAMAQHAAQFERDLFHGLRKADLRIHRDA